MILQKREKAVGKATRIVLYNVRLYIRIDPFYYSFNYLASIMFPYTQDDVFIYVQALRVAFSYIAYLQVTKVFTLQCLVLAMLIGRINAILDLVEPLQSKYNHNSIKYNHNIV